MHLNHFTVSGNLTRDPEIRSVGADRSVTAFTIANSNRYKTAEGEQREEVAFIDCEAWGRQGELVAQYLAKGSSTIVEGRIKQDNWTDKEGQKRSKLKMVVERVHLMPRARQDGQGDAEESMSEAPQAPQPTANRPAPRPAAVGNRPAPRAGAALMEQPPF